MAVERIADRHRLGAWRAKFQGLVAEGEIGTEKVLLLKPQTFMNDSGRSVQEAARFLKIEIADVVVIYDEIDLAPGKLRVKAGGGNAGHNGLRSISAHMENEYLRVRIGVGHPGHKDAVAGYVLHDFAKADAAWLEPLLDAIADAAPRLASGDPARFMTDVARLLQIDGPGGETGGGQSAGAKPKAAREAQPDAAPPASRSGHPAGERNAKRQSALAENLRKWMAGRRGGGGEGDGGER
jgi:PTH1 family peptidyl-tRNA hydrolase